MSTEYSSLIKIPDGIEIQIEGDPIKGYIVRAKGPLGENSKFLKFRDVFIEKTNDGIRIYTPVNKSKYRAVVGTYTAHI
ncbi:MAG: 50S ribosomal protein L6, partial [Archaeoglobaceae archaeon]